MSGVQTKSVEGSEEGLRLDRWFKRHFPDVSHITLEKLLRTGQVRVDGGRVKAGHRLMSGQSIRIPPISSNSRPETKDKPPELPAKDRALMRGLVLYEDEAIIVLNKPHGLAVQGGTKTERHLDGLLAAFGTGAAKPRLVHRLDRDTSGVMVVGRTAAAAAHLARAFRAHDTRKLYWALTNGVPQVREGRIEAALKKAPGQGGRERMRVADDEDEDAQGAVTRFALLDHAATKVAWLALEPVTGRTHQIRAHCALIRCPIIGDPKYGGEEAHVRGALEAKLHLHARALRVPHPGGGEMTFVAEPPSHFARGLKLLGFKAAGGPDPFASLPARRDRQDHRDTPERPKKPERPERPERPKGRKRDGRTPPAPRVRQALARDRKR